MEWGVEVRGSAGGVSDGEVSIFSARLSLGEDGWAAGGWTSLTAEDTLSGALLAGVLSPPVTLALSSFCEADFCLLGWSSCLELAAADSFDLEAVHTNIHTHKSHMHQNKHNMQVHVGNLRLDSVLSFSASSL